jgi:hypothetical protein
MELQKKIMEVNSQPLVSINASLPSTSRTRVFAHQFKRFAHTYTNKYHIIHIFLTNGAMFVRSNIINE